MEIYFTGITKEPKYSGSWVAVADENVLASGKSLKDVMATVGATGRKARYFRCRKRRRFTFFPLIFDYEEIVGKFYPIMPIELETREKTTCSMLCGYLRKSCTHPRLISDAISLINRR